MFREALEMKRQQDDMEMSERTNKPDELKKKRLHSVNKDEEAASSDNHVPSTKRRNIERSKAEDLRVFTKSDAHYQDVSNENINENRERDSLETKE